MSILRSPDCINSSDSHFHSSAPSRIEIFVIFTAVRKTFAALWSAGRLARGLPAPIETSRRRLCHMRCRSMNSRGQVIVKPPPYRTINLPEVRTSSHVCLCLELREALAGALTAGSDCGDRSTPRLVADAPLACSIFLRAPFGGSGADARPLHPGELHEKTK
jgi:hypothetical protein